MIDVKKAIDGILDKFQQKPVLLWTNPNPSANFASQDISINLTDYASVLLVYKCSTTEQFNNTFKAVEKGTTNRILAMDVGRDVICERTFAFTNSGASFGSAFRYSLLSSSVSQDNDYCIPYKIYGIKWGGYSITSLIKTLFLKLKGGVA